MGWNTTLAADGAWVPTFPSARYPFGRVEYDALVAETESTHPPDNALMQSLQIATRRDSIDPIVAAGLATLVEMDARLCEEVRLVPKHGHSAGHVSVLIQSRGEEALITGDFVQHPCHLTCPDWA